MRGCAAALVVGLVLAGCSGGEPRAAGDCGFPDADPAADESLVPPELLLTGTDLLSAERHRGTVNVVLAAPWSVQDALDRYRDAVGEAGFRIVSEDNEGFEAELYLRRGRLLAMTQVRRTVCADRSIVFFRASRVDP